MGKTDIIYQIYEELLKFFRKNPPNTRFISKHNYYFENGEAGFKAMPQLIFSNNETEDIIDYLFRLDSINNLVNELFSSGEKLNNPILKKSQEKEEFKSNLIRIILPFFEKILNKYNIPEIGGAKFDLSPIKKELFTIDIEKLLSHINTDKSSRLYYYLLFNFEIPEDEILLINTPKISLKKINNVEKSKILDSSDIFFKEIHDIIFNINTAIYSTKRLKRGAIFNALSLLRLYKSGEFQYLDNGVMIYDTFTNEYEFSYIHSIQTEGEIFKPYPFCTKDKWIIYDTEIISLKAFFKNNFGKIQHGSFDFAKECLTILHTLNYKYRIPIIFYIIESFFKNIRTEVAYRIKNLISKILEKDYQFSENMKALYQIRSDIVHGNTEANILKTLRKIKLDKESSLSNIDDGYKYLEKIMRDLWCKILSESLFEFVNFEEKYF